MRTVVDVVLLHRARDTPPPAVVEAIQRQAGVDVQLHFHVGHRLPSDLNRWFTIARARNEMKSIGTSPWVMFVDDDVMLSEDCILNLLFSLKKNWNLGAVGADYSGDLARPERRGHIALGATLWRRSTLDQLRFRETERWCECWCAAFDLDRQGVGIEYVSEARALHLKETKPAQVNQDASRRACILAAFDRRDIRRFEHHFLATLRASRNFNQVLAIGYGLYPSEAAALSRLPNVRIESIPNNGQMVPVRRLQDFARITAGLLPDTPVAYWDVADVLFQDSLAPLWQQVANSPDKLLAVAEPKGYPYNAVIPAWSLSIRNSAARFRAFSLLQHNPFLNSGFAAGTASTMNTYFEHGKAMLAGPELFGTTDWGDQMALNIYCHSNPQRWLRVDQRWNYCVHDRRPGEVYISNGGRVNSKRHKSLAVIHGNARSLRQFGMVIT